MTANNKPSATAADTDTKPVAGPPADAVVVLYATFPERAAALTMAHTLVECGAVACANVLPGMTSVYRWQGAIETADEVVLLAKLSASGAEAAVAMVTAGHPYDVPAVVVWPVTGGHAPYLDWVRAGTTLAGPAGT